MLSNVGKEIPAVEGASFPLELNELASTFRSATTIYGQGAVEYAPKWVKFIWKDLYYDFFMYESSADSHFKTVDAFLMELQRKTDEYHQRGGEDGIR